MKEDRLSGIFAWQWTRAPSD